jgi:bifunctional non-homologous end joining protein LigD
VPPPNAPINGVIQPCIPTRAAKPPAGPDWVHEIKHDGYRLIARRHGDSVRLFTRGGFDWSDRYPAISRAAAKLRARSFTIDGEAAVCGPNGLAIFDALHRRGAVTEAMLFAFDLLELDGVDYRPLPLGELGAFPALAEDQEPGEPCDGATSGGALGIVECRSRA